jgi:membrane associated rhomboid family serine protease
MSWRVGPRGMTGAIGLVTIAASLAITLSGNEQLAAIGAGFIPARVDGLDMPREWWVVPVWLTPLSATLVHVGPIHLALNMLALLVAGRPVEQMLRPRSTLLLYVAGAYAAAAGQWLAAAFGVDDPIMPMAGASGAISALIAASMFLQGSGRARAFGPLPAIWVQALWLTATWVLLNIGIAAAGAAANFPIAWAAHVGGFVAGLALAHPLRRGPTVRAS